MNSHLSNERVQQLAARLRELRGPDDGRGAFLGDGIARTPAVPIRSVELAELLEELIVLREQRSL